MSGRLRSLFLAALLVLAGCGAESEAAPAWSRDLPGQVVAVVDGAVPDSLFEAIGRISGRLGLELRESAGGRTTWIAPAVEVGYASLAESSAFREAWQRRSAAAANSRDAAAIWAFVDLQILVDSLRATLQRDAPRALGLIDALGLTNLRFAVGEFTTSDATTTMTVDVVSASPEARPAAFLAPADRRPSLLPPAAADDRAAIEIRFVPAEVESAIGAFTAVLQGDSPMGILTMAGGPLISSAKRAIAAGDGRLSLRLAVDGAAAIAIGARDPLELREALAFLRRRPTDESGVLPFQFLFIERADHLLLWRGREPSGLDPSELRAAASMLLREGDRALDLRVDRQPSADLHIRAVLR
ncbi:MAG: hypothetical protein AB7T19_17350 [Planctomycetota bacterium]